MAAALSETGIFFIATATACCTAAALASDAELMLSSSEYSARQVLIRHHACQRVGGCLRHSRIQVPGSLEHDIRPGSRPATAQQLERSDPSLYAAVLGNRSDNGIYIAFIGGKTSFRHSNPGGILTTQHGSQRSRNLHASDPRSGPHRGRAQLGIRIIETIQYRRKRLSGFSASEISDPRSV